MCWCTSLADHALYTSQRDARQSTYLAYAYLFTYAHLYIYTYVYLHTYVCTWILKKQHICIYKYINTYIVYIQAYIHTDIVTYVHYIHICTYLLTHMHAYIIIHSDSGGGGRGGDVGWNSVTTVILVVLATVVMAERCGGWWCHERMLSESSLPLKPLLGFVGIEGSHHLSISSGSCRRWLDIDFFHRPPTENEADPLLGQRS